jgi:glycosyltransferase involved in cell wall biosynthesis
MKQKILFTCGREPEYPRNSLIRSFLEKKYNLTQVVEHSKHAAVRYSRLASRLPFALHKEPYDAIFIGFLGHPLVLWTAPFTATPILFDAFVSFYDTACFDRQYFKPSSLLGRLAFMLDRMACMRARHILLDTETHVDYFAQTFGISRDKFSSLYVGCDEAIFFPRPGKEQADTVLFYGSYLPLHGVETIIRAANLLRTERKIKFRIIGQGIQTPKIQSLVEDLGIDTIEFLPNIPLAQLPEHISQATVCLGGHFGSSQKASRVIAGKTFQCLAMGKPTIVGDNPANRELLTPGVDAIFCKMNDPQALANSILTVLKDKDLQQNLGKNARLTFEQKASEKILAEKVYMIFDQMISNETTA